MPPTDLWEHKIVPFTDDEIRFNQLGREGWELVTVSGSVAYFKRRLSGRLLAALAHPIPTTGIAIDDSDLDKFSRG